MLASIRAIAAQLNLFDNFRNGPLTASATLLILSPSVPKASNKEPPLEAGSQKQLVT
jgi:hypothetical protein